MSRSTLALAVGFALAVACLLSADVIDNRGAQRSGTSVNSYVVERDGRYFEVDRGLEAKVLQELTPEQFRIREAHHALSRRLSLFGTPLVMGCGLVFIVRKLRARPYSPK